MHLLNATEESILKILLKGYEENNRESFYVYYDGSKSPWITAQQWMNTKGKLENEGIYMQPVPPISGDGDLAILTPASVAYFVDKQKYLAEQENNKILKSSQTNNYYGQSQQINIANDNSVIHATQNIGIDTNRLLTLINEVKNNIPENISIDDLETVNDSLEVIENMKNDKPKKGLIRAAFKTLGNLKYTAEFADAVTALYTFVQSFL